MSNFSEDPERYGCERSEECHALSKSLDQLQDDYNAWDAKRKVEMPKFESEFYARLDGAFDKLQMMTVAVLGCTDEQLNAISLMLDPSTNPVISTIRVTHQAFDELRSAAEASLKELGEETGDQAANKAHLDALKPDVQQTIDRFRTLQGDIRQQEQSRKSDYDAAQNEFNEYQSKIVAYDNLLFFDKLFASNAHEQYGQSRRNAQERMDSCSEKVNRMHALGDLMGRLLDELVEKQNRIDALSADAITTEYKLVAAKKASAEIFSKTYDLDNCLTSTDVELSVKEALKHILQLLTECPDVVSSDTHAKELEERILAEITAKYGAEETEDLKTNRAYFDPI